MEYIKTMVQILEFRLKIKKIIETVLLITGLKFLMVESNVILASKHLNRGPMK